MKRKVKRDKAFIGAAIGSVAGIASSIFGGISQKKAAQQQAKAQNRSDTYAMADNLSEGYGDQEYADDFKQKITFKAGGMCKGDRVKIAKKMKCGGRIKKEAGGEDDEKGWTANDTGAAISGIGSAVGNVLGTIIGSGTKSVSSLKGIGNSVAKTEIKTTDYSNANQMPTVADVNKNTNYNDRMQMQNVLRCGGKRKRSTRKAK